MNDEHKNQFVELFKILQGEIYSSATVHGFHDKETEATDGEFLCLIHAEISEALESIRHGNPPDKHIPELLGVEVELADAVIRIMDFAESRKLRLTEAIMAKVEYNKSRPYKHGGKVY